MREAVADKAKFALFDVLLNRVKKFLFGDLEQMVRQQFNRRGSRHPKSHLKFGIGPSWDLNDHVQHRLLFVGIQRHIVERRDGKAIFLDESTELQGIGSPNLADTEFGRLLAVGHLD